MCSVLSCFVKTLEVRKVLIYFHNLRIVVLEHKTEFVGAIGSYRNELLLRFSTEAVFIAWKEMVQSGKQGSNDFCVVPYLIFPHNYGRFRATENREESFLYRYRWIVSNLVILQRR